MTDPAPTAPPPPPTPAPAPPPPPISPAAASATLCPYCGHGSERSTECTSCGGLFEPLSRQATQNGMGPWFIRDDANPHLPGCSYDVLRAMVRKGRVRAETILRGPTSRQFWLPAGRVPGVAHLLGRCHACDLAVTAAATECPHCRAPFSVPDDRQYLGLAEVRWLPGQQAPAVIAAASLGSTGTTAACPSPTLTLVEPQTPARVDARPARPNPPEDTSEIDARVLHATRERRAREARERARLRAWMIAGLVLLLTVGVGFVLLR